MALRGRAISIIVVVAVGIASFIAMRGNWDALETARDRFYEQSRFGDVFASAAKSTALGD